MRKSKFFKAVSLLILVSFIFSPQYGFSQVPVDQLPQGAEIVSGGISLNYAPAQLGIGQSTDSAIINWHGENGGLGFSIGANARVDVSQPTSQSILMNRDMSGYGSHLMGRLSANGRVFVINTNGILFGANSQVDTAGLIASTLDITDSDFLDGDNSFNFSGAGNGSVVNQGTLNSPGGFVGLLGGSGGVENVGTITAELGSVVLAAGEEITVKLDAAGIVSAVVNQALSQNLSDRISAVKNTGTISADGGLVLLTAKSLDGLFDQLVNNEGIIEANVLNNTKGIVRLEANQRVKVAGVINAEGGTVTVDSQGADFSGTINAAEGIYNMNDGHTYIYGGTYTGNQTWLDNEHIVVKGDITGNDGSLTFRADNDGNGTGDFFQDFGFIITTSITSGDVNISGYDVTVRAISSAKDINIEATNDVMIAPAWRYKENFTIDPSLIDSTLTDFPVLIKLDSSNFDFSQAQVDGSDVRFVGPDGKVLSYEIESWNSGTQEAFIWVKLDSVSDSLTTTFSMYHDDNTNLPSENFAFASYGAPENDSTDVWSNGYLMVHHMNDYNDSTANGNDGTNNGTTLVDGEMGNAADFDGSSFIDIGNGLGLGTGDFTIETWYKGNQSEDYIGLAGATPGAGSGYTLENHNGQARSWINNDADDGSVNIADGSWHNVVLARSGGSGSLYVDGAGDNIGFATSSGDVDTATDFMIGGWGDTNYLTEGQIDEVRVSNVARSDAWLKASYEVGSDPLGATSTTVTTGLSGVNVNINSSDGAVVDANSATTPDITADSLSISAAQGIGSGDALETQVSNLEALNTISGNIEIDNTGDLTIAGSGVNNIGGAVDISTASPLTVNSDVLALGDISLAAAGADGDLSVNAAVDSSAGNVGLDAGRDLAISQTGSVVTDGGDIDLTAAQDAYVTRVSTDGTFTGSAIPALGTVTVTAGGNINDAYDSGNAVDGIDKVAGGITNFDISANTIDFNAGGDIGFGTNGALELRSNNMSITAQRAAMYHAGAMHFGGFDGDSFSLINSGDLWLDGAITTNNGLIDIAVVDDPNLYVNALINSGGGDVILAAVGDIIHSSGGDVYTGGGSFTGSADSDGDTTGFYDLQNGSVIDTTGATDGEVYISADDINVDGIVDAGTADITIAPSAAQTIALAAHLAYGQFRLSNDEIYNLITSGFINIGSSSAGTITINNLDQPGLKFKLISSGDVQEQGSGDIGTDIVADTLAFDVDGNVGLAGLGNGIETEIETLEGRVGGLINLNELTDLAINQLIATDVILLTMGYDVYPFNFTGSIIGNSGFGPNIISDTAILDAKTSIDLKTRIGSLSAQVRDPDSSGDITIRNKGAIALNDLPGWGYAVKNFGSGNIDITTGSPMTVNADVVGNSDVSLAANGSGPGADMTVNADVISLGSGTVNVHADNDLVHNTGTIGTRGIVNVSAGNGSGNDTLTMNGDALIHGATVNVSADDYMEMNNTSSITGTDIFVNVGDGAGPDNFTMNNRSSISGTNVTIDVANLMRMYNTSAINATNARIDAFGLGMHNNSSIEARIVDVNLDADLRMFNNADILGTAWVDVDAQRDVLMNNNSTIRSGRLVDIYAAQDLIMSQSSALLSDGSINVVTGRDTIMNGSSDMTAGYDVNIDADGQVVVSNSTVTAGHDANINAVGNISLGVINAGDNIRLTSSAGDILDTNGNRINLTAPNLYMNAAGTIGVPGDHIDTNVDDIWQAIALGGDVWINELDGVNLWDIQALGSVVDIITGGDTYAYSVLATGSGPADDAVINLDVNSGTLFVDGTIEAFRAGDGNALITADADNGISVYDSSVIDAWVNGNGNASVSLTTPGRGISIRDNSLIRSRVRGGGDATVIANATNGLVSIVDSDILARIGLDGDASIDVDAGTNVTVTDSDITSTVVGTGNASVDLTAGNMIADGTLTIDPSLISASALNGTASVVLRSAGPLQVLDSTVSAAIGNDGDAEVSLLTHGPIASQTVDNSTIEATVGNDGDSTVFFGTSGNTAIQNNSIVRAFTAGNGDTTTTVRAWQGIDVVDSTVSAITQGTGDANVELSAGLHADGIMINFPDPDLYNSTFHGADLNINDSSTVSAQTGTGNAEVFAEGENISVANSTVSSNVTGNGNATVKMVAGDWTTPYEPVPPTSGTLENGDLTITDSTVSATVEGDGDASVDLSAGDNIAIDTSYITASVLNGNAYVDISTENGDITIDDSEVKAIVSNTGHAEIDIDAASDVFLNNSDLLSQVLDGVASAIITIDAGDNIGLTNSRVAATSINNGPANVEFHAGKNIGLRDGSVVRANSFGNYLARIFFDANDDIRVIDSRVVTNELNLGGLSRIRFDANRIGLLRSDVIARALGASAWINLLADNDIVIKDSLVSAFSKLAPSSDGGAYIGIHSDLGNVTVDNSTVRAIDPPSDTGVASVNITAGNDLIVKNDSLVRAINYLDGESRVNLQADHDIKIEDSTVEAILEGKGQATVNAQADNNIEVTRSTVLAKVELEDSNIDLDGEDLTAEVNLSADEDVKIASSDVKAEVRISADERVEIQDSDIKATVNIEAEDDVEITNDGGKTIGSLIDIVVNNASNWWNDVIINSSLVKSLVDITADDKIEVTGETVESTVNIASGDDVKISESTIEAETELVADDRLEITDSDILATVAIDAEDDVEITEGETTVKAEIDLVAGGWSGDNDSNWSDLVIEDSTVKSLVDVTADDKIEVTDETIESEVTLKSSDDVKITDSTIEAELELVAQDRLQIESSDILATIEIEAQDDVEITNAEGETIKAEIDLVAGGWSGDNDSNWSDLVIEESTVKALVDVTAEDTIEVTGETIESEVTLKSSDDVKSIDSHIESEVELKADERMEIVNSNVLATVDIDAEDDVEITNGDDVDTVKSEIDLVVGGWDPEEGNWWNDLIIQDSTVKSTIDIEAGENIEVTDETIEAQVDIVSADDVKISSSTVKSEINLEADERVEIQDSDIKATVNIEAEDDIEVDTGHVEAYTDYGYALVGNDGDATVNLEAGDNTTITDSTLEALVGNDGDATINVLAANDITIDPSTLAASVVNDGDATVNLAADKGNIEVIESTVIASVGNDGDATILSVAGNSTTITDSTLEALVGNEGIALVDINTLNDVNISNSDITADVDGEGHAEIGVTAQDGEINVTNGSTILAQALSGSDTALVELFANLGVNITDSTVSAEMIGDGDARATLISGNGDVTLANSSISASVGGTGSSEVDIYAWEGNIYGDATSLVSADFAGLLARHNIGTSASPFMTAVDYLSAYSWDVGNIYVNELDSITLGTLTEDAGTLYGLSVAANNGIINVSSGGDMTVNSVIAPRGGVYLESRTGSIYAGTGWDPSGVQPDVTTGPDTVNDFARALPMDLTGTPWSTDGGIDVFSHYVVDPVSGPNVIAGSYSYFSTPEGTIGIGNAGVPVDADNFYNPLNVNIQAVDLDPSKWAVPAGFTPVAGLTLEIGGAAPGFTLAGPSGTLGVSGAIEGIVRPGVTAVTGVFPSPDIDLTNVTPPGYIFYDDTDTRGASPLFGPAAANLGPQQIWPDFLPEFDGAQFLASILRDSRTYYELMANYRFSTVTPVRSTDFYAYHPLTVTDESGFDGISLDSGAYEFIEQNINLKGTLAPYFGGKDDDEKKKKKATDL
ncbi:MAG: DUF2341 domain-containing protein [Candidatus Omnitrophica bacterium]|nr:DUF2341 domain-containing protein [Candidatus Omnitrophota bacterium]